MIYHETEHGVLHCGDCLDILPTLADKSVDLVLTDPPYGIAVGGSKGAVGGSKIVNVNIYGEQKWDKEFGIDKNLWQIIKQQSKNQIVFGYNYAVDIFGNCRGAIIWDKKQRNDWDDNFSDAEIAYTSFNRPLKVYRQTWMGLIRENQTNNEKRQHPTQKPIGLFEWCLSNYSEHGSTILDPFAGSGTTAIACIRLNRKYILIEKEEKYCEIAARRIETELEQTDLFREEF